MSVLSLFVSDKICLGDWCSCCQQLITICHATIILLRYILLLGDRGTQQDLKRAMRQKHTWGLSAGERDHLLQFLRCQWNTTWSQAVVVWLKTFKTTKWNSILRLSHFASDVFLSRNQISFCGQSLEIVWNWKGDLECHLSRCNSDSTGQAADLVNCKDGFNFHSVFSLSIFFQIPLIEPNSIYSST